MLKPASLYCRLWLPSLLLIVVAAFQRYLVYAHHLDPWVLGGFSMFAHVDQHRYRVVRVACVNEANAPQACSILGLDAKKPASERLRYLPSRRELDEFGRSCLKDAYTLDGSAIGGVLVKLSSITFNETDLTLSLTARRSTEVIR